MSSPEMSPARNRAERRTRGRKARTAGAALTAGSAALAMGAAWIGTGVESAHAATTITVSTLADTGSGSLRDAITTSAPGDTIDFQSGLTGTITLGSDLPKITHPLTISGPGAAVVTIDGNDAHRPFYLLGTGDAVTISGLTLDHGRANFGGAIANDGDALTLDGVVVENSTTTVTGGGGIESEFGTIDIENSQITGNSAPGNSGGGLYLDSNTTVTINNTTISNNTAGLYGGGLYGGGTTGAFTISNSTIADNTTDGHGGGAAIDDVPGTVAIINSVVSGNTGNDGGGVWLEDVDGGFALTGSTVTANHALGGNGGGLKNLYGGGSFAISNSSITGNDASDGGGGVSSRYLKTGLDITGSVVSGNTAKGGWGGGIYSDDSIDGTMFPTNISTSTIADNTASLGGGGVAVFIGTGFTLTDSTVSGNTAQSESGGGIHIYEPRGQSSIANSTVTGNVAAGEGGGVSFHGYYGLTLAQSTITDNTGATVGGVDLFTPKVINGAEHSAHQKSADTHVANKAHPHADEVHAHSNAAVVHAANGTLNVATVVGTILTGNHGTDIGDTGSATGDHSIIGTVSSTTAFTDGGGTQRNVDPMLGPLANNGGPTQTMALLPGSPAIDAGPVPVPSFTGNEFDQRGSGFARVVAGTVDIGAFEVQPATPIDIAPKFTG